MSSINIWNKFNSTWWNICRIYWNIRHLRYGYSDGSFSVDIDGGLPFSYTITSSSGDIILNSSNTSETNINIDNLFSDIYTLMFIDFNNCEFVYDIIVDSPSEIVSDVNIVETTCFSNNDGSIELNINGGFPLWYINV